MSIYNYNPSPSSDKEQLLQLAFALIWALFLLIIYYSISKKGTGKKEDDEAFPLFDTKDVLLQPRAVTSKGERKIDPVHFQSKPNLSPLAQLLIWLLAIALPFIPLGKFLLS